MKLRNGQTVENLVVFILRKRNRAERRDRRRTGGNARAQNVGKIGAALHHRRRGGNHAVACAHGGIDRNVDALAIIILGAVRNDRAVFSERKQYRFCAAIQQFAASGKNFRFIGKFPTERLFQLVDIRFDEIDFRFERGEQLRSFGIRDSTARKSSR